MSSSPVYDPEAKCLGCGCTDTQACIPPCSWIKVDYAAGVGICSNPKCSTQPNLKKYELEVLNHQRKPKR